MLVEGGSGSVQKGLIILSCMSDNGVQIRLVINGFFFERIDLHVLRERGLKPLYLRSGRCASIRSLIYCLLRKL